MHHRARMQIEVCCVAAPQRWGNLRAVIESETHVGLTAGVGAHYTLRAMATGDHRLDRNAVTLSHIPSLGGLRPDSFDEPNHLVAWNDRHAAAPPSDVPLPLLVIGTAEPTAFNPQNPLLRADLGKREFAKLKVTRALEHRGQSMPCHDHP